MRIAIAGGTGTLGRPVAAEPSERGHEVRVLSRHAPEYQVDLTTGAGLAGARRARRRVSTTSWSIVGCDRLPVRYYQVKTEQEDVVARGPLPWTIVRATQFHELIAGFLGAAARYGVVPAPRGVLQPIAAADAARAVADVAVGEPRRGRVEVAGPEVVPIGNLAATWRRAAGRRALLVPLPVPGRVGRALRDGWLTAARPDVRGSVTFATWASS